MNAPPLLVSYSSLDDYLSALNDDLRDQHAQEITELVNNNLPPIVSIRCLALLFGYSAKFINSMYIRNYKYYRTFKIRRGRKKREINAPRVALKTIQKWFGYHLSHTLTFNEAVYGFIPERSAVDAAAVHCNAQWVYSVDVKDFFPTTTYEVIKTALQEIGYSDRGADIITKLNCYGDKLAQGSPSSPVLSNLVMRNIDEQLAVISQQNDIRFTRYADDIVLSGVNEFNEEIKEQIQALFNNTCWVLSPKKEYFAALPKRLKVHGLLVHGGRPRLTKGYRNKIRAFKHLVATGNVNEEDIKRIMGHIKYADSVDNRED